MNKLKFIWLLALVGVILSLVMATSTLVLADWEPGDPYKMHFPQMPDEAGWDVNATVPIVLADDWGCIESGWVKDIHFWGSWMHGIDGIVDSFALSIHANIPEPPDSSTPGETLQDWITSDFIVVPFTSPTPEGWYDPPAGQFFFEDHMTYYQYNIFLPESLWFWQEEGTIYWLNISAFVHDPSETQWGWKSTLDHWMDDAVWAFWGELNWIPMYEPPYFEISLDLAFVITGGVELDFGDAPDPNYPTLLANDGARHTIVPGVFLGATIDPELNGQPSADALGDDNNNVDDEDGVVFTSLVIAGQTATVKVTASVGGFLDAWVDFNANGDWADAGEQIFASQALVAGVNYLTFPVPTGAATGTTFGRFRFSTAGGLAVTGLAPDGEVEDYRVFILSPVENIKMHWPQTPDLDNTGMDVDMHYFPLADDWLCTETGAVTDIHFWGSFADDILPASGVGNLTFQLTIHANIPGPPHSMPGIDLWSRVFGPGQYKWYQIADNNPEDWYDPVTGLWANDNHLQAYQYEFYITEDPFVQEQDSIYWLSIKDIPPPDDYKFGWKTTEYALRWNDDATWLCDPPAWWCPLTYPDGHEHEFSTLDLAFVITGEPLEEPDFGDAPDPTYPSLLANDGARHLDFTNEWLGNSVNGEPDSKQIDADQFDDGVVLPASFMQGQTYTITLNISTSDAHSGRYSPATPIYLHGWIDWNDDGDWNDFGENIFCGVTVDPSSWPGGVNTGTVNRSVTVPGNATVGFTWARFRLDYNQNLNQVTGLADYGEVEDYQVYIEEKPEPGIGWWFKSCYPDYAPAGMPDFDQKQDTWDKPFGSELWTYCGPVAVANCFWWIDSRFEALLGPGGGFPGDGADTFPLVRDYNEPPPLDPFQPGLFTDDHGFDNVDDTLTPPPPIAGPPPPLPPFPGLPAPGAELVERLAWCMDTDAMRTGYCNYDGTYQDSMQRCIDRWIDDEGLDTLLYEHTEEMPSFEWIEDQVKKSQDVILLLGFWWQDIEPPFQWYRAGGHYVTVAGVHSEWWVLAFSDPFFDNAEPPPQGSGGPGCVHFSQFKPHSHTAFGSRTHNDAGNASHDWYGIAPDSPSPGGIIWIPEYPMAYEPYWIEYFTDKNYRRPGDQDFFRHWNYESEICTEVECAVVVSPYPDYSDAPDPYPEAHHSNWTEEWLGESVSAEPAPRKDDLDTFDDGVTFFEPYNAGYQESLKVTITVRDRFACETTLETHGYRYDGTRLLYLHGWIDWNDDDDWYDLGENIFCGVSFDPSTWTSNSFVYTAYFTVPADAETTITCARFRLDYHQDLNDPGYVVDQAWCGEVEDYCEVTVVSVPGERGDLKVPQTFELAQNYPNPFNLQTAIRYQIPEDCFVTLDIYNLLGQNVRTLVSEGQKANSYTAYWDGKNTEGGKVTSGIYFYTLRAGKFTQTRRMVILK